MGFHISPCSGINSLFQQPWGDEAALLLPCLKLQSKIKRPRMVLQG